MDLFQIADLKDFAMKALLLAAAEEEMAEASEAAGDAPAGSASRTARAFVLSIPAEPTRRCGGESSPMSCQFLYAEVTHEPGFITVAVADSGPRRGPDAAAGEGPGPALNGSGLGLAGIAERVASCGGRLSVGPTGAGGFSVSARLPIR